MQGYEDMERNYNNDFQKKRDIKQQDNYFR